MLNKCLLNGRVVSDIKVGPDGKYGFITLAVKRNYKNKAGEYDTDFFDVFINGEKPTSAWSKYFEKGDGVIISGELYNKAYNREKAMDAVKKILAESKVALGDEIIKKITYAAHPGSVDMTLKCGFPEFGTAGKKQGGTQSATTSNTVNAETELLGATTDDDDDLPF